MKGWELLDEFIHTHTPLIVKVGNTYDFRAKSFVYFDDALSAIVYPWKAIRLIDLKIRIIKFEGNFINSPLKLYPF